VVIIDVIEHIVDPTALAAALGGLAALLAPGGRLLIAPLMGESRRHLFYVHFWSREDVLACVPQLRLEECTPFRQGELASLHR
jgi:2-polyprenyl-3-methyl-5-hydroxy-6-metoxy-1,4-benzoquinol methylase